jgi:HEPN domain-containing protein
MFPVDTIQTVHEPSARSDAAYATAVDTSSVASGAAPRKQRPYAPGEIVSLWDMLRVYAKDFVVLMQTIDRVRTSITHIHQNVARSVGAFAHDPELIEESCAGLWESVGSLLVEAEAACTRMELKEPVTLMRRVRSLCDGRVYSIPELQGWLGSIVELIQAQLGDRLLMCVASDTAAYWSDSPLFGEMAQKRLPRAVDDMVEAGKCLAVGRYTACVFHLMRVVEVGAKYFAVKKCKLAVSHKAMLGNIVGDISGYVARMPTATPKESDKKTAYSQAADHLSNIKDGWRNKTMHPGLNYTKEEADRMFKNVVAFTGILVGL